MQVQAIGHGIHVADVVVILPGKLLEQEGALLKLGLGVELVLQLSRPLPIELGQLEAPAQNLSVSVGVFDAIGVALDVFDDLLVGGLDAQARGARAVWRGTENGRHGEYVYI